jgi:hypothetical protein
VTEFHLWPAVVESKLREPRQKVRTGEAVLGPVGIDRRFGGNDADQIGSSGGERLCHGRVEGKNREAKGQKAPW